MAKPILAKLIKETPFGYCLCGCGQKTKIATKTHNSKGIIAGQPLRWIQGHHNRVLLKGKERIPLEDRFWSRVKTSPNGCWEWQGYRDKKGYGHLRVSGRMTLAHRCAYVLIHEYLADDDILRHKCDNPSCVRPSHLETGTRLYNVWDSIKRGRRHRQSHLTPKDVRRMREIRESEGLSYAKLAALFKITEMAAYYIVKRRTWKHVD